ncbi:MAG: hypothetical protein ACI37Z_08165 [Candidatus Gastranaerophilaceae bacterium]
MVFFTNAYGALCVRTGEKYKIYLDKKEIPVDIEIKDTGILEFENYLRNFLNSDERINSTFYSTLHNKANTYQIATNSVKEQREKMYKFLEKNKMSEFFKLEDNRAEYVLYRMHDCIDSIFYELYGHIPAETEFMNLSNN